MIQSSNKTIIIAGGGTGGHLFPALAIGEEINRNYSNIKIHYIGSIYGLEAKVFPVKGVWHSLLPIRGFQRDLRLTSVLKNISLPFKILKSLYRLTKIFNEIKPDMLIATGGYASAIPLLYIKIFRINIDIYLQEQNSFPGITTKYFSNIANKVFIAFKDAKRHLNRKVYLTGNPVRSGLSNKFNKEDKNSFNFDNSSKTIFLFGGSQGSLFLNELLKSIINNITNSTLQLIWQTGDSHYKKYKKYESKNVFITPFINDMHEAYNHADLVISRSGALTLAELTICGKPSILIPFNQAAGNHQMKNATALSNVGAAEIHDEANLDKNIFYNSIKRLIHNEKKLKQMAEASLKLSKPNATKNIVEEIFNNKNIIYDV